MEITQLTETDTEAFKSFKECEWKIADQEHYRDAPPDFSEHSFTLLAKDGEAIVGQIYFIVSQGVAKVDSLLVGKSQQGTGVGRSLMAAAEEKATEVGAHKISLETGLHWEAKKFYEKLGYEVRAVLPNDVAHQDFVLMDKMLG